MKKMLCPSMMCADFAHLEQEIKELEDAGADIFHCDVMDGVFVPNIALGLVDVQTICRYAKRMVDVHLMVERPSEKVDWFIDAGARLVYIHPEAERYVVKTLAHIRARGCLAGLAINPDTSVETVSEMLHVCDYVMVMTVNPGFAGQSFIDFTEHKIRRLAELKQRYGYQLVIDGACSPQVVSQMSALGVDGFVLGTSALFGKQESYKELLKRLR